MELEIKMTRKITLPPVPLTFSTDQGRMRLEDLTIEQVESIGESWKSSLLNTRKKLLDEKKKKEVSFNKTQEKLNDLGQ